MVQFRQISLGVKLIALLATLLLHGCGDTENTGTSTATTTSPAGVTLSINLTRKADGADTSSISNSSPGTVVATLRKADGTRPQSVLVTFTTDLGVLNPETGTALTDSAGEAEIDLLSDGTTGAGTVTAQASVGSETLSVNMNFAVTNAAAASSNISAVLRDNAGTATNTVRADSPGTLTVTVTDESGNGIQDLIVVFTTTIATLDPSNGTAITNASGQATMKLRYKVALGADTVAIKATLGSESLTTSLNYQVAPPAIQLGSGSGAGFTTGTIAIGVTPLSPGATTALTVNMVDSTGAAYTTPIDIAFTSNCVSAGKSTVDATVTTQNGQAVATYQTLACVGTDTLTASASYGGSSFSATANLVVTADTAGSIEFVSATPTLIGIKNTGGVGIGETSTVKFKVKGTQGLPLANQLVSFAINTSIGGLTLAPANGYTNSSGEVSTTVRSGTVATSARVTASVIVGAATLSSQSSQLTISTGIPDQNSISISTSIYNPEGVNFDGETATLTARLADHFNNPAPDGTSVYFSTEGGAIQSTCLTVGGSCSVVWTAQEPRPINHRSTVLVVAVGNESFYDEDGNGLYSDGDGEPYYDINANGVIDEPFTDANSNSIFDEPFIDNAPTNVSYDFGESFVDHNNNGRYDGAGNNIAGETLFTDRNGNGTFDGSGFIAAGEAYTDANGSSAFNAPGYADLPEAFVDINENGVRNTGEPYWDFNNNGAYDTRDGQYNGVLCTHTSLCSPANTLHVRDSIVLVMSGSYAAIVLADANLPGVIYGAKNLPGVRANTVLDVTGTSATIDITLMDSAGQSLPAGTTVAIAADKGELSGITSFTIPNEDRPGGHTLQFVFKDPDAATTDSGALTITISTPLGVTTYLSIATLM